MQPVTQAFQTVASAHLGLTTVKTTLYELIEAITEEVQPAENHLVPGIVLDLLDTGKIRFLASERPHN